MSSRSPSSSKRGRWIVLRAARPAAPTRARGGRARSGCRRRAAARRAAARGGCASRWRRCRRLRAIGRRSRAGGPPGTRRRARAPIRAGSSSIRSASFNASTGRFSCSSVTSSTRGSMATAARRQEAREHSGACDPLHLGRRGCGACAPSLRSRDRGGRCGRSPSRPAPPGRRAPGRPRRAGRSPSPWRRRAASGPVTFARLPSTADRGTHARQLRPRAGSGSRTSSRRSRRGRAPGSSAPCTAPAGRWGSRGAARSPRRGAAGRRRARRGSSPRRTRPRRRSLPAFRAVVPDRLRADSSTVTSPPVSRRRDQVGAALDAVGEDDVVGAAQPLDAFDGDALRAGALDRGAHGVEQPRQVLDLRLARAVLEHRGAARRASPPSSRSRCRSRSGTRSAKRAPVRRSARAST